MKDEMIDMLDTFIDEHEFEYFEEKFNNEVHECPHCQTNVGDLHEHGCTLEIDPMTGNVLWFMDESCNDDLKEDERIPWSGRLPEIFIGEDMGECDLEFERDHNWRKQ